MQVVLGSLHSQKKQRARYSSRQGIKQIGILYNKSRTVGYYKSVYYIKKQRARYSSRQGRI